MSRKTNLKSSKSRIDSSLMNALLKEASGQDLFGQEGFFQKLKQNLVNSMLEGEMDDHLGYEKHSKDDKFHPNRRNGHYDKTILSGDDELALQIPRDRQGGFEPHLIPKGVRRLTGFDDKVISLYARGMTMREIQEHLFEIYGTDVSHELISTVTDKVIDTVSEWQNRALDEVYPIVYLDCLHVKIKDNNMVLNKAVYVAIGVDMDGKKDVLGLWVSKNEGAKFWMQVVNEIKNRGVSDIFIACVDGLKGFEDAINAIFPETNVQLCIVHMVRNSLKFVPWKEKKIVAADLRKIYTAPSQEAALENLEQFEKIWGDKYQTITQMWRRNWTGITHCFAYPHDIRKVVYTTNAIEAVNRQIRKIIKNKGVFPNDQAAIKLIFLALNNAQKKWTMPIPNWPQALNQFAILFENRVKM